jgi:hypothetical protein
VWSARQILAEIARYMPDLDSAFAAAGPAPPALARGHPARLSQRALGADRHRRHGAQPTRLTLPVSWHWSDVGTWESLAQELGVAPAGRGRWRVPSWYSTMGEGNLVWGQPGRPVALLGVEGMAVVDTGDALLVARLDRSNDVRLVVKALKAQRRSDVT